VVVKIATCVMTKAVTTMTSAVVSIGGNSGNIQERIVIVHY
jgi:hypothetical protein